MQNDAWGVKFEGFAHDFGKYIKEFTPGDWSSRYIEMYQDNKVRVQNGCRQRGNDQPLFKLNCAIKLLLDGRQKLTASQRKARKELETRWIRLERSCGVQPTQAGHRIGYPEGYKEAWEKPIGEDSL